MNFEPKRLRKAMLLISKLGLSSCSRPTPRSRYYRVQHLPAQFLSLRLRKFEILCTTFLTANCHTEGSLAGRAAYSPDRHVAARLLRDTSKADNNTNCPELSLPEQLQELKRALMRPLA